MRLIHTTTLRFKEFFEPNLPKYAIVSHTWDDEEEVNYQEFLRSQRDESVTGKAGYRKIVQCCKIARGSGSDYLWIDTCCI